MTKRTPRVALLSPQDAVVEHLRAILATMSGGVEFVPLGRTEPDPDVVLYDAIGLVHGDQTDLKMLVDKTSAHLLVISRDLRPGLAALALAAGADGHFSLGAEDDQILAAMESAVADLRLGDAGDVPLTWPDDGAAREDVAEVPQGLSRREAQFLGLIGQGWSNSEIVEDLHLSPNIVKTYIRTACRKIGARNRAQAASWAITHGGAT
jgi:DNA-binding NarL/FixJ family response regulator